MTAYALQHPEAEPPWPDDEPTPMRPDGLLPASMIERPEGSDEYLVGDLIRPRTVNVFAASEGLGKSVIRHELSVRAATGTGSLLGVFAINRPMRVLALDLENGPDEEWRNESRVLDRLGIARTDLGNLFRRHDGVADVHLTQAQGYRRLCEMVRANRPDLLLLDTGTAAVDEEYGKELKLAARNLQAIVEDIGCAVVVGVHLTKPPREGKDRFAPRLLSDVMGHWTRRAAAAVVMSATEDDRVILQTYKRVPRRKLLLSRDDGLWTVVADLGASAPGAPLSRTSPRRTTRERVAEAIAGGLVTAEDIANFVGVAPKTVLNHVTALRAAGRITGMEGSWSPTDAD